MTGRPVVIEIPGRRFPGKLLNVNSTRGQTRYLAARIVPWRTLGTVIARGSRLDTIRQPVQIWAEFRFPDDRRRDTGNLYPTIKALLDGLVDAGVLCGDHDGLVEGPWLRRIYPNGPLRLRLVLVPVPRSDVGLPFGARAERKGEIG